MKKLILIFSYKYPYEPPVEQFLHAEMPYFDRADVDVVIVPYARGICYAKKYDTTKVVMPMKRGKISDILLGMSGVFSKTYRKENKVVNKIASCKERHYAKSIMLKYFMQAKMFCSRIKKIIKKINLKPYDEVVLYSYWFNSMAIGISLAKEYLSKKGVKCRAVSRAHGQGDLYVDNLTEYRPFCEKLKSLDKIYSISSDGMRYLSSQGLENVELSRLGVNKKTDFKTRNSRENIIVSCSVINTNKRVNKIAETLSTISDNLKWIHFGGGQNEDELREWCKNNMPENVKWDIKGWTKNTDVIDYYLENEPNVFINLSEVEGIPVSIMEAMACGIPCVATNVGATSEIVFDKKNGRLVQKDFTTEEVKEAICGFLNKSDDESRIDAYNTWCDIYNSEKNFTKFVESLIEG